LPEGEGPSATLSDKSRLCHVAQTDHVTSCSDLLSRHVNKTHCPPGTSAPGPAVRKKKAKGTTAATSGQNGHSPPGPRDHELNIQQDNFGRLQGRQPGWTTDSSASNSTSPPQYATGISEPCGLPQKVLPHLSDVQHHQHLHDQHLQTARWAIPTTGSDVIEQLTAGTGDIDGDDSEDDQWGGTSL
jgi:hypothetical protein